MPKVEAENYRDGVAPGRGDDFWRPRAVLSEKSKQKSRTIAAIAAMFMGPAFYYLFNHQHPSLSHATMELAVALLGISAFYLVLRFIAWLRRKY
jgi:hypothetical protein